MHHEPDLSPKSIRSLKALFVFLDVTICIQNVIWRSAGGGAVGWFGDSCSWFHSREHVLSWIYSLLILGSAYAAALPLLLIFISICEYPWKSSDVQRESLITANWTSSRSSLQACQPRQQSLCSARFHCLWWQSPQCKGAPVSQPPQSPPGK